MYGLGNNIIRAATQPEQCSFVHENYGWQNVGSTISVGTVLNHYMNE